MNERKKLRYSKLLQDEIDCLKKVRRDPEFEVLLAKFSISSHILGQAIASERILFKNHERITRAYEEFVQQRSGHGGNAKIVRDLVAQAPSDMKWPFAIDAYEWVRNYAKRATITRAQIVHYSGCWAKPVLRELLQARVSVELYVCDPKSMTEPGQLLRSSEFFENIWTELDLMTADPGARLWVMLWPAGGEQRRLLKLDDELIAVGDYERVKIAELTGHPRLTPNSETLIGHKRQCQIGTILNEKVLEQTRAAFNDAFYTKVVNDPRMKAMTLDERDAFLDQHAVLKFSKKHVDRFPSELILQSVRNAYRMLQINAADQVMNDQATAKNSARKNSANQVQRTSQPSKRAPVVNVPRNLKMAGKSGSKLKKAVGSSMKRHDRVE